MRTEEIFLANAKGHDDRGRGIRSLIRQLSDEKREVRLSASMALADLGEPAIVPLVRAMQE